MFLNFLSIILYMISKEYISCSNDLFYNTTWLKANKFLRADNHDPSYSNDLENLKTQQIFSSMIVIKQNTQEKFGLKYIESVWKEGIHSTQQSRKIIREFYSKGISSRWPNKTVPYEISPELKKDKHLLNAILTGIEHWENLTCIKFEKFEQIKHSLSHKAMLEFSESNSGCFSDIGYPDFTFDEFATFRSARIYLEKECKLGQIIHEIGHLIGFFHEQSRIDRDKYIEINWENIADPTFNSVNFESAGSYIEKDNLNIPYDISSIMHYPANAFSKDYKKTIQVKDKNLEFLLGNRAGLSFYDKKLANLAYKCSESCKNPPICLNDGFLSKDCKCVCPDSLTGINCETFIKKVEKSVSLNQINLNCNFTSDLCSWTQEKLRDETDFVLNSGKSVIASHLRTIGIPSDRFNSTDSYLYLNTFYVRFADESSLLVSPLISIRSPSKFCLSFWYHMYGTEIVLTGELSVYIHQPSKSDNMIKIWSRAGRQNHDKDEWLSAQININVKSDFRIIIKAQRLSTYFGDIGIDDISFDYGKCKNPDNQKTKWTDWFPLKSCFQVCGSEFYEMKRFCQVGTGSKKCIGIDYDKKSCNNPSCDSLYGNSNTTMNASLNDFIYLRQIKSNFMNKELASEILVNESKLYNNTIDNKLSIYNKCGGIINLNLNETYLISSPNYPYFYPHNSECSYILKSNEEKTRISLKLNYLDLESTEFNGCPDSLEVRYFALGQTGVRLCGFYTEIENDKSVEYLSEKETALLIFRSDWIKSGGGFSIISKVIQ